MIWCLANTESWVQFMRDSSCFPVSVGVALSLGYGDWSERKDSGSLVWERGGRKGNQATWANTWGSAQTLSTQMCTQLRLPGSRRRLCCSLITTFFSFALFCLSFFTLLLSALYSVCLLFSFVPSMLVLVSLPPHLDDYSKIKKELWTEPATNESAQLGPIWGHHHRVQHSLTHPQHKPAD